MQNIQATIKNAPDNVIGMVKGLSDNIITNTVESINKIRPNSSALSVTSESTALNNNKPLNSNSNLNINSNGLDKDLMTDEA